MPKKYCHFAFVALVFLLTACASQPALMPTPNLHASGSYKSDNVPESLRTPAMKILYLTDRAQESSENGELQYGAGRSGSLAYGVSDVNFRNPILSWNELVNSSNQSKRKNKLKYAKNVYTETGRFPTSPYKFVRTESGMQIAAQVAKEKEFHTQEIRSKIRQQLKNTHLKDVVVFVHGYNNTLDDAIFTTAGLWHFLDRQGVPIAYSWPAAKGGLTGYFTDRESGEFTVFHLKEFFRILFATPEIENIHVVAHSRGTDVVTSTLRELLIENRAAGENVKQKFKIANLILAAPDLDFGIITQRLMTEQFALAFDQITIYTSQGDSALGFSQKLMSGLRFGRLLSGDVNENEKNIFTAAGNVQLINVPKSKGFIGHDYFKSNPAVSSDIIQLVKYKARPGTTLRPLESFGDNFWGLDKNYLQSP